MNTPKKLFFIITYFIIYTTSSYCMYPYYDYSTPTYTTSDQMLNAFFHQNIILNQQNEALFKQNRLLISHNEDLRKQFEHTNLILQQIHTNNIQTGRLVHKNNIIISTKFARQTIKEKYKLQIEKLKSASTVDEAKIALLSTEKESNLDKLDQILVEKIKVLDQSHDTTYTDTTQ